jgi:hypothetical protein
MIKYWRTAFNLPDLPFFYVLLAAGHTAVMREAQVAGAGAIAHTAFASALDLGAAADEFLVPGHPPRKQEVGRRVSLLVRGIIYKEAVDFLGPRVIAENVTVTETTGDAAGVSQTTVMIPFDPGTNGDLHMNSTGGFPTGCESSSNSSASPVELVDLDAPLAPGANPKVIKTMSWTMNPSTNVLTAVLPGWQSIGGHVEVRFLYDNDPTCAVYNGLKSGPDSVYSSTPHLGLVAQTWRGNVTVGPHRDL